jgi:hypothetical protein
MNMLSSVVSAPSARARLAASNAAGMSSAVRMSCTCNVTPSEGAALSIAFTCIGAMGSARKDSTSTREIPGTSSLSSSSRLTASQRSRLPRLSVACYRFPPAGAAPTRFRIFQMCPRTRRPDDGRLKSPRSQPRELVTASGGRSHVRFEAPRIHHAARRGGSRVAARCARLQDRLRCNNRI